MRRFLLRSRRPLRVQPREQALHHSSPAAPLQHSVAASMLEGAAATVRRQANAIPSRFHLNTCALTATTTRRCAHTSPTVVRTVRHGDNDLVVLGPDGGAFRKYIDLLAQSELLYAQSSSLRGSNTLRAFTMALPKQFDLASTSYLYFILARQMPDLFGKSIFVKDTDTVAAALIEEEEEEELEVPATADDDATTNPPKRSLFLALSTRVYSVPVPASTLAAQDDVLEYKGWWIVKVGGPDGVEAEIMKTFMSKCSNNFTLARAVALENEKSKRRGELQRRAGRLFTSLFHERGELDMALRPYPETSLIPAVHDFAPHLIEENQSKHKPTTQDDHPQGSLESFLRYPFILSGPSGTGKTVAALQLADKIIDLRSAQRNAPRYLLPSSVIGIYVCAKNLKDASTLVDRPHECENMRRIVDRVVGDFVDAVEKINMDLPEKGHDVTGMHLHIVLDEMGPYPRLVRAVVGGYGDLCRMVRDALAAKRTASCGGGPLLTNLAGLDITTAVVGTGVDSPVNNQEYGSIGRPFWRVRVRTCPLELISTHAYSPAQFAASVARDPLLSILAGNFRCAALLTSASHEAQYQQFARNLSPIADRLAKLVAAQYRLSNRWGSLDRIEDVAYYAALVISLLFTQHPSGSSFSGCHLLSDEEIGVLVTKLGAVDDRLCWGMAEGCGFSHSERASVPTGFVPLIDNRPKSANDSSTFSNPSIRPRSVEDAAVSSAVATGETATAPSAFSCSEDLIAQKTDLLRFHVPPSIAALALLYYSETVQHPCDILGGGSGPASNAARHASLAATAIAALLKVADAKGVSVPAEMMFSSFGRAEAPSHTDLGFSTFPFTRTKSLPTGASPLAGTAALNGNITVSAPYLCHESRGQGFGEITDRSGAFAVEVAAQSGSDLFVHADGLITEIMCVPAVGQSKARDMDTALDAKGMLQRSLRKGYRCAEFKVRITSAARVDQRRPSSRDVPNEKKGSAIEEEEEEYRFGVSPEVAQFVDNLLNYDTNYTFRFDDNYLHLSVGESTDFADPDDCVACIRSAILRSLVASRSGKAPAEALIICGARPLIPSGVSVSFHERRDLKRPMASNAEAIAFEESIPHSDAKPKVLSFSFDKKACARVACWTLSLPLLAHSTTGGTLPLLGAERQVVDAFFENETLTLSRLSQSTERFFVLRRKAGTVVDEESNRK